MTYKPSNLVNFLTNSSSSETEKIVSSIQDEGEQTREKIQEFENTITSTEYDDSSVSIDSSAVDSVSDVNNQLLFSTIINNFRNLLSSSDWQNVEIIEIGVPFTDGSIELRSDMISSVLSGTMLYTLINVAWYSLFGLYVFMFSNKLIHSIKDGTILNGFSHDEVITDAMM